MSNSILGDIGTCQRHGVFVDESFNVLYLSYGQNCAPSSRDLLPRLCGMATSWQMQTTVSVNNKL